VAGYSTGAKDAGVNAIRALLTSSAGYVSMHTGDPGTTGANEVTGRTGYARQGSTFPAANGGTGSQGGQVAVPIGTAGSSVSLTYWGLWTAATGGSWVTGGALSQTEVFSTAGGTMQFTPTLAAAG
jgi:hypothetical protein